MFRLHKKRAVLGASTSSDLRLDDASVSPVHAILEVSGIDGKPVIYDLASDTGIRVNNKPTVQATITGDDVVQIGPYMITVRVQELAASVPQAPAIVREAVGGQKLFLNEKEDLAPLLLEDESEILDIFDHRPESKLSLQVVMFFEDTILDVEHFVNKKRILIGPGTKEDFSIPPFLGKGKMGRFDLVTQEGGQYLLHLHDQMEGVLSQGGKMVSVKDAMASMSAAGSKIYPLGDKDFAKVKLNDVSFFMNFTPAPPRLKLPRLFERDPLFFKVWALSFALTAAVLVALASVKVNPQIEIEQLPERTATIIYENKPVPKPVPKPTPKPEVTKAPEPKPTPTPTPTRTPPPPKKIEVKPQPKPTTPPKPNAVIDKVKPKPQPKAAPAKTEVKRSGPVGTQGGSQGEGARAKGTEGSAGKPDSTRKGPPQTAAKRPGPGNPKKAATGMGTTSETDDLGVVDMFKNEKGTLNKVLAGGKGAANAADKLEGYSGFTTKGAGGLGAAGTGSGGGGTSEGLGALSDKGAGGGRKGTGLGQFGSGGKMLGGSGKLAIEGGGSPEPIVMGAIDTDAIARAIAAHRDEIKYCYEKEINADNPDMAGRVSIRFVIGASGVVNTAGVASTSLRNANTEKCVVDVIRRIQFPPVRGGGIAEVTYPFVFKPSNK